MGGIKIKSKLIFESIKLAFVLIFIYLIFAFSWFFDGVFSVNTVEIKKMKINNIILAVPVRALWLPPLVVGGDYWSKEGYKIPDQNKLQDFSVISLRGCWVLGKGIVISSGKLLGSYCERYGRVTDFVNFSVEAKPSGYTKSMLERVANGRLKDRVWGYPDGLNYKKWFSKDLGVEFMRLTDKTGNVVSDRELWNVAVSFSDEDYVECPVFAITGNFAGSCTQKFVWDRHDIVVNVTYKGEMVRYKGVIRRDVLGFLVKNSLDKNL